MTIGSFIPQPPKEPSQNGRRGTILLILMAAVLLWGLISIVKQNMPHESPAAPKVTEVPVHDISDVISTNEVFTNTVFVSRGGWIFREELLEAKSYSISGSSTRVIVFKFQGHEYINGASLIHSESCPCKTK